MFVWEEESLKSSSLVKNMSLPEQVVILTQPPSSLNIWYVLVQSTREEPFSYHLPLHLYDMQLRRNSLGVKMNGTLFFLGIVLWDER